MKGHSWFAPHAVALWTAVHRRILSFIAVLSVFLSLSSSVVAEPSVQALTEQLQQSVPGRVTMSYHSATGKVRFLKTESGRPIPHPSAMAADATPEDAAAGFLHQYGPMFGISDAATELSVMRKKKGEKGRSIIRYQQIHHGVPVIAGELMVDLDAANDVLSVNGEVSPAPVIDTLPTIDAAAAMRTALGLVAKHYRLDVSTLTVSKPELWIYNPALLGGGGNVNSLVWRMQVRASDDQPVDELVLVDAHAGYIALHFNQMPHAKYRMIYDNNNDNTLPLPGPNLMRSEGGPVSTIADVNTVYDLLGTVYDFYLTQHGRDSIDGLGMNITATTRYCQPGSTCPWSNAMWNGSQLVFGQVVFGQAYITNDVVAHEYTHGVTQYESGLFYYMQSGAINESLSDIWGEFVDVSTTADNSWLHGEDLPGGANRSLANPPDHDQPDKMTSNNVTAHNAYYCGTADNGGVHVNSGVGNKAGYLITHGDTFNGKTVSGLGVIKASKIYYEVQTNILTSGSDYADLYDALQLACSNLTGSYSITAADCDQVKNAVDAVEMNLQPINCAATEAPFCAAGTQPYNIFFDNFESGGGNWQHAALIGTDAWIVPQIGYATSGTHSMWGRDLDLGIGFFTDSYVQNAAGILIPTNAYMHFNHAYDFEYSGANYYDGGVLEYSTNNGATWQDTQSLFVNNGYNDNGSHIYLSYGNPLAGRPGFVGISNGYISSRLDLAGLAGQNVKFRFRIGTDDSFGALGWLIDDVRVYRCLGPMSVTVGTSPSGLGFTVDGTGYTSSQVFSWYPAESHSLGTSSPQAGTTGVQYIFSSWSDGNGSLSRGISSPDVPTTYTANFATQYLLTTSVNPGASGTINPDCSAGCWYNSGLSVSLFTVPVSPNTFSNWSGGCGTGTSMATSAAMTSPRACTANFSSCSGDLVTVDGNPTPYATIALGYAAAPDGGMVRILGTRFDEHLILSRNGTTINLLGGRECATSAHTLYTALKGDVTITDGTVIMDRIIIW